MEYKIPQFDTETFINLVQCNPCLWDSSHENYSNKNVKQQCWIDISKELYDNYKELATIEQIEYTKDIQKKWKNLRNSFAREMAKRRNKKSGVNWKTYMYFEQLSFLTRWPLNNETSSNCSEEGEQLETQPLFYENEADCTALREHPHKKFKASSNDDYNVQIAELLRENIRRREESIRQLEGDEDRHFLFSLLGDFKKIPLERKIDVKLTFMQAIRNNL